LWTLRSVNCNAFVVQLGRDAAEPAASRPPEEPSPSPSLAPPPVPPEEVPAAPEESPDPDDPAVPEPSPPLDSSRPPGCWLIAGPVPDGPGVIDDVGCFPLEPLALLFPPSPPEEVTTQTPNKANRATMDSSTALRRQ